MPKRKHRAPTPIRATNWKSREHAHLDELARLARKRRAAIAKKANATMEQEIREIAASAQKWIVRVNKQRKRAKLPPISMSAAFHIIKARTKKTH